MGIYFIVWVIIHYCHLFCCSSVMPGFSHWELLHLGFCAFQHVPMFSECPLLSGPVFRAPVYFPGITLYFPYPTPDISHVSKERCFILLEDAV